MDILAYCQKTGIRLNKFAQLAGIPQGTLCRYANRKKRVGKPEHVKAIMEASNGEISIDDLIYTPVTKH